MARVVGLDRLWAPWRMPYLRRASTPGGCLFCRVARARADRTHLVVARRLHALLMLNRFPYNPGHLMVAVASHTARFAALTHAERDDVMDLVALAERALAAEYRWTGSTSGRTGRVAGAGFRVISLHPAALGRRHQLHAGGGETRCCPNPRPRRGLGLGSRGASRRGRGQRSPVARGNSRVTRGARGPRRVGRADGFVIYARFWPRRGADEPREPPGRAVGSSQRIGRVAKSAHASPRICARAAYVVDARNADRSTTSRRWWWRAVPMRRPHGRALSRRTSDHPASVELGRGGSHRGARQRSQPAPFGVANP